MNSYRPDEIIMLIILGSVVLAWVVTMYVSTPSEKLQNAVLFIFGSFVLWWMFIPRLMVDTIDKLTGNENHRTTVS